MRQPVDSTLAAATDVPVDEVYIPPPDYSMSEELMAIPPGIVVYKLHITEFRSRIIDFCMYRCAAVCHIMMSCVFYTVVFALEVHL